MVPNKPWRTALIDSQALLRDCLARAIHENSHFDLVAELEDPMEQPLDSIASLNLQLVVMDVVFPDTDGIGFCKLMMKRLASTRFLVLTGADDSETINKVLGCGAHGIVPKAQPLEILEDAMIEVASGGTYFPAALFKGNDQSRQVSCPSQVVLTIREQEILTHVANGSTSRFIANRLGLSCRSVETYRSRIMRKLQIPTLAGLISFAICNGFKSRELGA